MVTPAVLIPRLETETLVREGLRIARETPNMTLLDVGTGSGIIAISLARHVAFETVYITDTSKRALRIAMHNAIFHGVEIEWIQGNLLNGFLRGNRPLSPELLITANLPYVRQGDWEHMSPDTQYEPPEALFGGPVTGFELYEEFFGQIARLITKRTFSKVTVLVEIGYDQRAVCDACITALGWQATYINDHAGIARCVRIDVC